MRRAFGTGVHISYIVLEYVHSDVCGTSHVASHPEKENYVTFINDYAMYVWIYFLPCKFDVLSLLRSEKPNLRLKQKRR